MGWLRPPDPERQRRLDAVLVARPNPEVLGDHTARFVATLDRLRLGDDDAASELEELMRSPLSGEDRDAWGAFLVDVLEDPPGEMPRGPLVRALADLGYPWALHVHPDDLVHLEPDEGPVITGATMFVAAVSLIALFFG